MAKRKQRFEVLGVEAVAFLGEWCYRTPDRELFWSRCPLKRTAEELGIYILPLEV